MGVSVFLLALLPVAALSAAIVQEQLPEDCDDVFRMSANDSIHSGVYTIYPPGYSDGFEVYCDMDCEDEENRGGWTVFQRRVDGSLNFYQKWETYKNGFGNLTGEHWLGLEKLFAMTWQKRYRLRVDMEDFEGGDVHAEYNAFSIHPESDDYRLEIYGYVDGGAGDDLRHSNRKTFCTFDHGSYQYYARRYHGAFWYDYNAYANPNGLYQFGQNSDYRTGVIWRSWKGYYYSLKKITMKIRLLTLQDLQN